MATQMEAYNVGEDCPVFNDLFRYCQLYAGGSVGGAVRLNHGLADVAINWSGGMHHAKKKEASGFWYVSFLFCLVPIMRKEPTTFEFIKT